MNALRNHNFGLTFQVNSVFSNKTKVIRGFILEFMGTAEWFILFVGGPDLEVLGWIHC